MSVGRVSRIIWYIQQLTREHIYNLMNLAFDIESDGLCQLPEPGVKKADRAVAAAWLI